jgi:hypothetical protein
MLWALTDAAGITPLIRLRLRSRRVRSEAEFRAPYIADYPQPRPWMTLDIASGSQPCNPFIADHVRGIKYASALH